MERRYEGTMNKGPKEGRDLELYMWSFALQKEDFTRKTILDLGAGPNAKLSKDLQEAGVDATVISLSPEYTNDAYTKLLKPTIMDRMRKVVLGVEKKRELAVAAVGEALPFKDGSFDMVLALFSLSTWSMEKYREWLLEVERVLKPGGIAYVGPLKAPMLIYDDPYHATDLWNETKSNIKNIVERQGAVCTFQGQFGGGETLVIRKIA
jgi:ubiquinone/menaquinone biosynthesis C-methylase UbiE